MIENHNVAELIALGRRARVAGMPWRLGMVGRYTRPYPPPGPCFVHSVSVAAQFIGCVGDFCDKGEVLTLLDADVVPDVMDPGFAGHAHNELEQRTGETFVIVDEVISALTHSRAVTLVSWSTGLGLARVDVSEMIYVQRRAQAELYVLGLEKTQRSIEHDRI